MIGEHRVDIARTGERSAAAFGGETIADSARGLVVRETGHEPVLYFPLADVAAEKLRRTGRRTRCPWKGEARYWTICAGGVEAENAAWEYPEPIPAAAALRGHVAFYADRVDICRVEGAVCEDAAEFAARVPQGKRVLGVDPGERTLGLALSDPGRAVASPRETLRRGRFRDDGARLADLCAEEGVGGVVVGLPRNMDASEGPRARAARDWAANAAARLGLPALLWDERLSTAAVERAMIAADMSRARRAARIDRAAAAWILQGALDAMGVSAARGAPRRPAG